MKHQHHLLVIFLKKPTNSILYCIQNNGGKKRDLLPVLSLFCLVFFSVFENPENCIYIILEIRRQLLCLIEEAENIQNSKDDSVYIYDSLQ